MDLIGKTVLITGAAQGIGRASARACIAAGARVIATDISAKIFDEFSPSGNVNPRLLDVSDKVAIERLAQEGDEVDVLFNCAGIVQTGTILDSSDEDFYLGIDINVRSQYWLAKTLLPGMIRRAGGSIINMASVCSSVRGAPQRFVYGMTKAAVVGLTKSIAFDYLNDGIRCNVICPGTVDTPSLEERINASASPEETRKAYFARQPLGRLAKPDEISPLVVFLASDASELITGQVINVDGGLTI